MKKLGVTSRKFGKADIAIKKAEATMQAECGRLNSHIESAACRIGGLTVIGVMNQELKEVGLMGLGIIVSPKDDCPKGFEKIITTSKLNKKVHVCRLAKGYRKYEPHQRPRGKPMRRLHRRYDPGIEADTILPRGQGRLRKASRRLTE